MTASAAVPTGVRAPVVLHVPIVANSALINPPTLLPSLSVVHPVQDVDLTTVTAVSLVGTDPAGNAVTWACTLPPTSYLNWAASTAFSLNAVIIPNPANGLYYKATAVSGSGTSGSSEPSFPTTPGETVVDNAGSNQITWTCMGAATTQTALTATYAFTGTDTATQGIYQLAAQLTVSGGTIPCKGAQLMVTAATAT